MIAPQKGFALKISTLVVVTACFVVMGASLLLTINLQKILTLWGDDIQMTVYLAEDLTVENRQEIEAGLKAEPKIGKVELITQEMALGDFRKQLATYAPDLAQDDDLLKLIPASLQVSLSKDIPLSEQNAVLASLAEEIRELAGVEDVSYGQDWVEKYSALVTAIDTGLKGLGLVVLLASIFVMSNVIRASIESRREEIGVLELIGATSYMIRKPFLINGFILGGGSSLLALLICFGMYSGTRHLFLTQLSFLQLGNHLSFFGIGLSLLFVLIGVGIGGLGSYLCVRRINDGWAARSQA